MVDDGPAKAPLRKALKVSRAEPQETTFLGLPLDPTTTPPPPVAVNHQVQRLKIASLVFGVSLFLNWGIAYWVQGLFYGEFLDPYYFGWRTATGLGEMVDWLILMFVDAWLIDEYRFWFEERGPVPVGEVGKLLQEMTANLTLSQTLKDKFGGLKRCEFLIDVPFISSSSS